MAHHHNQYDWRLLDDRYVFGPTMAGSHMIGCVGESTTVSALHWPLLARD
ncbi:hypothetical protein [Streptomyces sp. NPDC006147]